MKSTIQITVALAIAVAALAGPLEAGVVSIIPLPGTGTDAASDISSSKTYTHALDFGSITDAVSVNDVPFTVLVATSKEDDYDAVADPCEVGDGASRSEFGVVGVAANNQHNHTLESVSGPVENERLERRGCSDAPARVGARPHNGSCSHGMPRRWGGTGMQASSRSVYKYIPRHRPGAPGVSHSSVVPEGPAKRSVGGLRRKPLYERSCIFLLPVVEVGE
jgi:hypothetical protein